MFRDVHPTSTGSGIRISSEAVKSGENAELATYADDRYVKCKQCGFPCHLDREQRGMYSGRSDSNLLTNGAFESNVTGWTATNCTFAQSSTQYHQRPETSVMSAYSGLITATSASAYIYQDLSTYADYETVMFAGYVYPSANIDVRLSIADGVGTSYSNYAGSGGWVFLSIQHLMDDSATQLRISVHADTSGTTCYVDNLTLYSRDAEVTQGCPQCGSKNYV